MSWSDIDRKIAQESVPLKDFLAKNKYNWKTRLIVGPKVFIRALIKHSKI